MGTLLQELGHDIVLLCFIDFLLKKRQAEIFYIVNSATGPKTDIHFWNAKQQEYTSAYAISKKDFIPEFTFRINLSKESIEKLNKESNYKNQKWYQRLSNEIGKDLKEFVNKIYHFMEDNLKVSLPDIIGITKKGEIALLAEIKFEGFGREAREEALQHLKLANRFEVPYYLVIPKKPVYGKEITDAWITHNLPESIKIYKFTFTKPVIVPKHTDIQFIEVKR